MSWGTIGQQPSFDLTPEHGVSANDFQIKTDQGHPATDFRQIHQLQQQGWMKCPNPKCNFFISPQAQSSVKASSGYFTCPKCHQSYDLMNELPWHGPEGAEDSFAQEFSAGGGTRIGIPMRDQAQIGENLVGSMKDVPGYGPITWWHPGGSVANSPLDGAVKDWGIEVKTLGYDSLHHRFIPGNTKERGDKNEMAKQMGLKGVLGILVLLDYRRDVADIYGKEMPLGAWEYQPGRSTQGVSTFRKNTAQKLLAEVPFDNPYKDPAHPAPAQYNVQNYYQSPRPFDAPTPSEPAPF